MASPKKRKPTALDKDAEDKDDNYTACPVTPRGKKRALDVDEHDKNHNNDSVEPASSADRRCTSSRAQKRRRKDSVVAVGWPPTGPKLIVVLRVPLLHDPRALLRASRRNLDAAIQERQAAVGRLHDVLQTRSNAIRARHWVQATHGPKSPQCRAARAKVLECQAEALTMSAEYSALMAAEKKIGPELNRLVMEVRFLREEEEVAREQRRRGRGGRGGRGDRVEDPEKLDGGQ